MATQPNPNPVGPEPASQPTGNANDPVVAFCQQCGRPLTEAMRRQLGSATFCEPCAAARVAHPGGWSPVSAGVPPVASPAAPHITGEPNPKLAAFLGLIPGVGAMYNGQYAKGAVHLIVFVVLVSLADNLNEVFYWLVWGWVFYQAFEAYHTAAARRDGLPLPDPFGWNDLGERIGMNRTSPPVPRAPAATSPAAGAPTPSPVAPSAAAPAPSPAAPYSSQPITAPAYSPYMAPFTPEPAPAPGFSPAAHPSIQRPFEPTFTGTEPPPPVAPVPAPRRFPLGALWLIGLGALFLLGNIVPNWRLNGRWIVPVLLGAAALWMGSTRVVNWRERSHLAIARSSLAELSDLLLFPALLFTFSLLFALQIAGVARLGHSWPSLLIVWGALLLVGRAADSASALHPRADHPNAPDLRA